MFSPTDRSVWVVVPFKGPVGSKRRLADLFDESERARLSLAMLDGVLDAVLGTGQVVRVLVMMPEDAPSPARHDPRLQFVAETPRSNEAPNDGSATDGLNRAIIQAQAAAQVAGVPRLLILPSDLPLIGADDVDALVTASETAPVVISPDRRSEGTNALLLSPPATIRPSFGVGSFERHRQLGELGGQPVSVVRRPGLSHDLDVPTDVLQVLASDQSTPALDLLRSMNAFVRVIKLGPALFGTPATSGA